MYTLEVEDKRATGRSCRIWLNIVKKACNAIKINSRENLIHLMITFPVNCSGVANS